MYTILCYGDSNTWGYNPSNGSRFSEEDRWPGVLRHNLGSGFRVIEEGKNGRRVLDDTEDLFAAIKAAEALDEIIIFLGINDICFDREIQIDDILEGVSHMLGLIRERYREIGMKAPEIILIGAVPINETQVKDGFYLLEAGKVRKFSEGLLYLATDAGCGYIDSGRIIESSQSDGIHLEAEEHRKLGLFVAEYTKSFLSNANLNNKRH